MGEFAIGSIILVTFPFSNLKGRKVRRINSANSSSQGFFLNLIVGEEENDS